MNNLQGPGDCSQDVPGFSQGPHPALEEFQRLSPLWRFPPCLWFVAVTPWQGRTVEERSGSPSNLLTTRSSWLFPLHNLLPHSLLPLLKGGNPLVCAVGHSVASLKVKYDLGMEKLEAVLGEQVASLQQLKPSAGVQWGGAKLKSITGSPTHGHYQKSKVTDKLQGRGFRVANWFSTQVLKFPNRNQTRAPCSGKRRLLTTRPSGKFLIDPFKIQFLFFSLILPSPRNIVREVLREFQS